MGVEGGVESPAQACVATFVKEVPETLPAASNAATPSEYVVAQERPVKVKLLPVTVSTCTPSRNNR